MRIVFSRNGVVNLDTPSKFGSEQKPKYLERSPLLLEFRPLVWPSRVRADSSRAEQVPLFPLSWCKPSMVVVDSGNTGITWLGVLLDMNKSFPRWSAESTDRLLATDDILARGAGEEEEEEEEEEKKRREDDSEDEDEGDGYSE